MRQVSVYEAVGMAIGHDITEIVPGKFKGQAFNKGHIIRKEDIPKLLAIGKEHLYIWDIDEKSLHENDAAQRFAQAVYGPGITCAEVAEGKVVLIAARTGLLKINSQVVESINDIGQLALVTLHSNQLVIAGKKVAGCKIIPLVIDAEKIEKVEHIVKDVQPVIQVKELRSLKVGIVTTGSEIYHGRITDQFGPVLKQKFTALGSQVLRQIIVDDKINMIAGAIHDLLAEGAELIVTTGGMSVDPDDVTPSGIRAVGGRVVVYGAPILPGTMFMLAYSGSIPIVGLPGCVIYHKNTILDLLIPRILAGEELTKKDITKLGYGGFCADCEECHFPNCSFGKGE
ncbi:molybdopterin-binding protein [Desulfosporosinus fructosivorans]